MKIAIIGYMGSGKSTAGVIIAEKLGLNFADIDEIMVYKQGMPISQLYITFGEKIFRSFEDGALREVLWHEDLVVVCGGGLPLDPKNMGYLQDFIKVYFTASAAEISFRLKQMNRPKIWDESEAAAEKAIKERHDKYSFYADITVDTNGKTPEEVADEAIQAIKKKEIKRG